MTEPNEQLAGRGRGRQISGCTGSFADLPWDSGMIKDSLAVQFELSQADSGPAEAVHKLWFTLQNPNICPGDVTGII